MMSPSPVIQVIAATNPSGLNAMAWCRRMAIPTNEIAAARVTRRIPKM
jgi:hypothetical protein